MHRRPDFWILLIALLIVAIATSNASEYRLQIAPIDEKLFLRYVETQGKPIHLEHHVLPRLEALLNTWERSKYVLLPEYALELLPTPVMTAGELAPVQARMALPWRESPWITATWQGTPGQMVAFRLRSRLANWQELTEVAVNTDGVLRRLPVRGVPLFGQKKLPAPTMGDSWIAAALERGAFVRKVVSYASFHDGLAVIVGRNADLNFPDTVYLVVRMPTEGQTYQVVLAWKDREGIRKGDCNGTGAFGN